MSAVSGAEMAATSIVLKKLFQAEPVNLRAAQSMPKPAAKCDERQRHVAAADVLHEAADQDDDVADHGEEDPDRGDAEARVPQSARQFRRNAAVALAADGDVGQLAQPALLHPERDDREAEQHRGQHRGTPRVVLRAGDGEEDLGREHFVVSGEHDRVAEVGEAFDESQQERIGERGPQERPGHGAENAPSRRAQRLRRLFQCGTHRGECAVQDHERDRRERQELRQRHAGQSVDPARAGDAECAQPPRDEAGPSEQHDQRERDHERRRDDRQDRHHFEKAGEALPAALHDQRQHEAEKGRQHADDDGEHRRIDRHAAAHAAPEAVDGPDVGREQALGGDLGREIAFGVENGGQAATCRPGRR